MDETRMEQHQAAINYWRSVAQGDLTDAQVATQKIRQEVTAENSEVATLRPRRGFCV